MENILMRMIEDGTTEKFFLIVIFSRYLQKIPIYYTFYIVRGSEIERKEKYKWKCAFSIFDSPTESHSIVSF